MRSKREKGTPEGFEARILEMLGAERAAPMMVAGIARRLGMRGAEGVAEVGRLLGGMEGRGLVARIRGDRYVLPESADLMAGRIQFRDRGDAFVIDESGARPDLHIAAEDTSTAMHGDRVLARVMHEGVEQARRRGRVGGRAGGRVIRILERGRATLVGTLRKTRQLHHVVADDPRFVHDIAVRVEHGRGAPRVNDKVVVRLLPWEQRHLSPQGEIIEVLGAAGAPGIDVVSIIRKHELPVEFPAEALREAERIPDAIDPAEIARREDLRGSPVFTVDPDDAKDFDDAVLVERSGEGWSLGVHIADVSHYVAPGSALDREALRRGNSVYLADRVLPMLPPRLSDGLCSLRPGEERLTHSVFIEFDRRGATRRVRFARSVIRSAARYTYPQVLKILGRAPSGEAERRVHAAWELAAILRERRFRRGSLDLDFPELKVRLDGSGRVERLERVENDISHQLIEEFMLAANEAVAAALRERLLPCLYRVHESPDAEKLLEYRSLLGVYGVRAGDLTQRPELKRALAAIAGRPEEHALKVAFLRSLKRAVYDVRPLGHYGLSKSDYAHFTSPIRRYADLVVHRALARVSGGAAPRRIAPRDLELVAARVSGTERVAAEAEMESVKVKQLEYFRERAGSGETFDAVVIDVRSYGLLVELPEQLISGMVHVSALPNDFYRFDSARLCFEGARRRKRYALGDRLKVRVATVDMFKRQIDFSPAG